MLEQAVYAGRNHAFSLAAAVTAHDLGRGITSTFAAGADDMLFVDAVDREGNAVTHGGEVRVRR